jgi:putative hydrolase of the HAD superfamily
VSDAARPEALLIDFGGVLTTNVFDSYAAFCRDAGLPADAVRDAFRRDDAAARLLVDAEEGRLDEYEFGMRFAELLGGITAVAVNPAGLLGRMNAGLRPEPALVDATAAIRRSGVTTILVSNSLGEASYDWCDFDELFDYVVLSGRVGVRKPSRRIFRIAAETAGVEPERCLMVDDLEQNLVGARRIGMRTLLHRDPVETVAELERSFGVPLAAKGAS